MNVTLEGLQLQKSAESTRTTTYQVAGESRGQENRGYTLDISGTVMDNAAYAGHGKTAEELVYDAQVTELTMQSEYVTVMSNSVSGQDLEKLREEGYRPCDMEAGEMVNTVESIKATLAEAGVVIEGYNDDLDMETLEQYTGSKSRALELRKQFRENDIPVTEENAQEAMRAYETATQIPKPGDGTTKYLVENGMKPTIENLYLASYSGIGDGTRQSYGYYDQNGLGYYAKKAESYDWEALREQMQSVIEQAGLPVDETSFEQAKFLIEKGIALTPDTLGRMADIAQVSYPFEEAELMRSIAIALADGKKAVKADLSAEESMLQQAVRIKQETDNVSEQALERVVADGKPLTIRNLWEQEWALRQENMPEQTDVAMHAQIAESQTQVAGTGMPQPDALVTAKRQLEEIRLAMTVQANYGLIKKGYAIDTTELSQLVDALKAEEAKQNMVKFQTEDPVLAKSCAGIYEDTRAIVKEFPQYPLAIVGRVQQLSEAPAEAEALRVQYAAAGERYETFMTKPRADFGDSIKKAFRNVDDILADMNMEQNEANRRAVRILGYNRMEVTKENMARIKDADLLLQRVVQKLTPEATLQMIRENQNPLTMSLEELEAYLTEQGREEAVQQEKFSEFLYRMERTGEMTEAEQESFLGIYRLFRQVEKSDGAVIGNLVGQQAELSVSGLLSALRTRKKSGMDVKVSDEEGGVAEVRSKGTAIDKQIGAAFRTYEDRLVSDIFERMDPLVLREMHKEGAFGPDVSPEQFRQLQMETAAKDEVARENEQLQKEYSREQVQEIHKAADINDSTIQSLLDGREPVTVHHLLAAKELFDRKNSVFRRLEEQLEQEMRSLPEAFTDKEQVGKAYEELIVKGEQVLEELEERQDVDYETVRDIHRMARQLKLVGAFAREEHYTVPVYLEEELTTIHLTLKHEESEKGRVSVEMDTQKGQIRAEFAVLHGKVLGNVECSEEVAKEWMDDVTGRIQEYVNNSMGEGTEAPASSELYGLAKAFIKAVQKQQ